MAAKKKIVIKKKVKNVENVIENDVKNVENVSENDLNVGTTVVENEISDVVDAVLNNVPADEESVSENSEPKKESVASKKAKKEEVLWTIGSSIVTKPKWRIVFEAQSAPFPMFKLPSDIRNYLQSKWLTTNVYKKSKEWLERHNVDLKMVERLKEFLTEKL